MNSQAVPSQAEGSERLQRIHKQVTRVKENQELGVKYMREWEEKKEIRDEGKAEGKAETLVNNVESAMKSFQDDLQKTCEVLGSSVDEYRRAKEYINSLQK